MKESAIAHCISFELLSYIQNRSPTELELLIWLGETDSIRYHVLRKAGLLTIENGIVNLSPKHTTKDKKCLIWGNRLYHIDEERIDVF